MNWKLEIDECIDRRDWQSLKEILSVMRPPDVADLLETLDPPTSIIIFRLLPRDQAARVFSELEPVAQNKFIARMKDESLRSVLTMLSPDDRTELLEEMPAEVTCKLLDLLSPEDRAEAMTLLGYPEDSVGRLMTPDYIAVKSNWSVSQALEHIRKYGRDAETLNVVYVVDENRRLIDDIPIRHLLLANPQAIIESLMNRRFIYVTTTDDQEEALKKMTRYNLVALPVVDSAGVLIGLVTVDDVLDVAEEETTEDFEKKNAIVPLEITYSSASPWLLYRKRVMWLLLLAVAGFFSSSVIAAFEETLAKLVALAFFIPVLIDSGGNAGCQSSTLIIRALSVGDLSMKKWFVIVKKEVLVGLSLGVTLGLVLFVWGFIWKGGYAMGTVIGISMICVIMWANLLGGLLPVVLVKLKLDPAVASSPLITTLVDGTGLVIYFFIARIIMHI
ncbi:magnesium transporter [bacterium]|nr:magnesium transporter [bacterium]